MRYQAASIRTEDRKGVREGVGGGALAGVMGAEISGRKTACCWGRWTDFYC
jgi:hypothetical protein